MKKISKKSVQTFTLIIQALTVAALLLLITNDSNGNEYVQAPGPRPLVLPLRQLPVPSPLAVNPIVTYNYGFFGRRLVPRIIYVPTNTTDTTANSTVAAPRQQ